ncbi:TBC1 domain family member 14-like [Notothenia coriiceps]|uniref:TBC1 domain family member 14-like n=1 Tax=Notothenia coriiceps TaxID=8208 RepID=A0A6I9PPV7_9TELE|nr:PREDICTED: TBC1 domain family member 14-like [Notothenia coriiceps]
MANTTTGTRDRRDSRCGLSGEAIVQNGCVVTELATSDIHNHTNNHHHDLSSTMHSETVVPTYKPSCSSTPIYYCSPQKNYSDMNQDCHSLTSQDSGIPTLEINPPEPIIHAHQRTGDGGLVSDSSFYSPATLTLEDSTDGNSIRKSSTFPRSGYDSIRHLSPALRLSTTSGAAVGALNRSDDISSMSSMSTELSVSNEDILDFTVTSSSSAIVTLETDDSSGSHFTDVTLTTSPGNPGDLWSPVRGPHQEEDGRLKKLGPLASLFNRSLFARRVKDNRPVEQKDPGWKLFGKVPLREGPIKDPKRIQKVEIFFLQMLTYFAAFEVFFEENLPKLFAHFQKNNLTPDIYLIDWIFTLYSKSLPLDLACRVWDVFCRDHEEFLFRTGLGLLRLYQDVLSPMDFIHMAQFLTRLPDLIPADQLFQHITAIHMTSRNRKWAQVLQALQKDPERCSPVLKR